MFLFDILHYIFFLYSGARPQSRGTGEARSRLHRYRERPSLLFERLQGRIRPDQIQIVENWARPSFWQAMVAEDG